MAGNRLWFAVQACVFYPESGYDQAAGTFGTGIEAHGVQDVNLTSNFTLTPIFELGQAAIYENAEGVPTVEITVSKVIDGYPLLLQLATQGCSAPTLMARLAKGCTFQLGLWPDAVEYTAYTAADSALDCDSDLADGQTGTTLLRTTPLSLITCPKCYVSNIQYSISTGESGTENLMLSGSQKIWSRASGATRGKFNTHNLGVDTTSLDNKDTPVNNVAQGYHVIMLPDPATDVASATKVSVDRDGDGSGAAEDVPVDANGYRNNPDVSVWPKIIPGIEADGTNLIDRPLEKVYCDKPSFARIQSVSVSAASERTDINMLGRKTAIYKSASSNVTVSSEVAVLSTIDDNVSVNDANVDWCAPGASQSYTLRVAICTGNTAKKGVRLYTGSKNKLTSVSFGQGGTGGGNVTATYSFQTSNTLTVLASTEAAIAQEDAWWTARASYVLG